MDEGFSRVTPIVIPAFEPVKESERGWRTTVDEAGSDDDGWDRCPVEW
jgi:hypothetical protein